MPSRKPYQRSQDGWSIVPNATGNDRRKPEETQGHGVVDLDFVVLFLTS